MAVIVAYRLEFCLKLAEVGQGIGAVSKVRCLSVSFGQGLGFLATSLESMSRNQKPQAAGRQWGSGLAGVESTVLPGLADTGGQEPQQQCLDVSPASGQGKDILLPLSCSGLALGS